MTTISNKASLITKKASAVTLMMIIMVAGILFAAPSLSMAQQQQQTTAGTATTTAAPTTTPLTPEEQQEQDRLQRTTAAITQNLEQGQKQINGIVYTPRWSNPVWVQPNSLGMLFVYCLPGEFAESGQHILGGSELEVLESYSLAVTNDLIGWLMIVENEHQTERLPAAIGAICSSDANVAETRILSPQEETVINNVIKQFTTIRNIQITNITQVINIINNVTTNGTGGGNTTRPPPTNNTGGGGNTTEPLTVQAVIDIDLDASPVVGFEASIDGGRPPYTCHWDLGDGTTSNACFESHIYENPGTYTATITVTDVTGQTASDSIEGILITPTTGDGTGGNNTGGITAEEEPPADGEETEPPADTVVEPPADGEETEPPTNSTGGQ